MKHTIFGIVLLTLPLTSFASVCEKFWIHAGGVSKHVEVYQPNEYTRYKRQTHPGFGLECQNNSFTLSFGQFTNSLDRPFEYFTASTDVARLGDVKLYVGLLAGEYGLTVREPLKLAAPLAYLEYRFKHLGFNFFALPPAKGLNDYAIFFTQFKIGF